MSGGERIIVAVLRGGPDAERAVSLDSGAAVADALRNHDRFDVRDHVIDRPDLDALRTMLDDADVVFPVLHGQWGEGGGLQTLLSELGIPYVGAGPRAARLAMNKAATKSLLGVLGVPTPPAREIGPDDPCDLDPPVVLKPVDDGSSVDLRICRTREEIEAARIVLHPRRGRLLCERYIAGREMTVGVLLDRPLPIIEIVPAVDFYDYDAKYERDDTRYVVNPDLPEPAVRRMVEATLLACRRLSIRDLARADFILDGETAWFLEINTMPGFTSHSLVPMAAEAEGMGMPAICAALVDAAVARRTPASPSTECSA